MTEWYVTTGPMGMPAWLRTGLAWLEATGRVPDEVRKARAEVDKFREIFPPGPTPNTVCEMVSKNPKAPATLAMLAALASDPDKIASRWLAVQSFAERPLVAALNDATVNAVLSTKDERRADVVGKLTPLLASLSELGRALPANEFRFPTSVSARRRGAEFADKFDVLRPLWSLALAEGIEFEDIATGAGRRDLKPEFFLGRDGVRISDGTETAATGPDGEDIAFVGKAAA